MFAETTGPGVSIVAEPILHVGPFIITNSQFLGMLGTAIALSLLFYTARKVKTGKPTRLSTAIFWLFEILLDTVEEVLGDRAKARKPLAITIFFVVMLNNWMGILPFVGPLTYNGLPLFRGLAADLNFTAALAVITMVTAQLWAIRNYGFRGNIGRYLKNPLTKPMDAFEGILELVAEFSRLLALAMRLFGNVFGGEVLLLVMSYITSYASPVVVPVFMLFELFVGAIQAYVFFMLTVVFVSLGTGPLHGADHAKEAEPETEPQGSAVAV
jgi:F-type H+-transporting ATPase subunit a